MSELIEHKDIPHQREASRDVNHTLHKDPATVKEINLLKESLTPPTYTPEESAQEKNRILGLLDSMKFDDTMRDIVQAAIRDKHVPKELIMSMRRASQTDGDMMVSILKNESRMTLKDQEDLVFATIGGESVLRELIRVAPETTVEIPMNAEGTEIETVPLTSMLLWLAPSKELVQKYGMNTAGIPTQTPTTGS